MKLGNVVNSIRSKGIYEAQHDRLREIGFEFRPMSDLQYEKIEAALLAYKALHGDMLVPWKFIVPRSSEYPEDVWDMKLGAVVNRIRSKGIYDSKHDRLQEIGFKFED